MINMAQKDFVETLKKEKLLFTNFNPRCLIPKDIRVVCVVRKLPKKQMWKVMLINDMVNI